VKIAVIGASGILGRALIPLLAAEGHKVRPASRHLNGLDLLTSDLAPLLAGCDAVVHAATAIPSNPSAPGAWDLNTSLRTTGTRRLLAAAQQAGVQRYVQQSITMAYQDGGDAWLDESTPFDPSSERASLVEPVRDMEAQVRASNLHWTILRGGQFAGPGTAQDAVVARLDAATLSIPCAGQHWISPIHPADMAAAVVAALTLAPSGSTFNITAEPIRYADYLDRLAALGGLPALARDPKSSAPCPASQRCTARAAHQILNWRPTHSIWPQAR
jgi:nucleoside-diphosphate-sugar epimerase